MSDLTPEQAFANLEAVSLLIRNGTMPANDATRMLVDFALAFARLTNRVETLEREVAELKMRGVQI